jgi:hypothetical protein
MSQNKVRNKKSICSMEEEEKEGWEKGVRTFEGLHLIPIFFHHCTKCTSKISEFKTLLASFHIQQQPTVSLSYSNHM